MIPVLLPRRLSSVPRRASRGFTLLEVLVVLMIGGLLVGLASLSLTRNPRSDLMEQAQRLALTFETAGDEAQLHAAPIEWQPMNGGYRFMMRDGNNWRPLVDELLGPTRWKEPISAVMIRYPEAGDRERSAGSLAFGTESIGNPARVTLVSAAGSVSILTDGSGRFDVVMGRSP